MRPILCFLFLLEVVHAGAGSLRKLDGFASRKPVNEAFGHLQEDGTLSSKVAVSYRSSKPDGSLLSLTQHLLKSIKEGRTKCTGLLESSRHDYDLAMEFSFDLSDKLVQTSSNLISIPSFSPRFPASLNSCTTTFARASNMWPVQVSLDDVDVSHFNGESEFFVKSAHQGLKVGNVLLGSLVGQWAKTPGSFAGLHSGINQLPPDLSQDLAPKTDNAHMGGLAHLSVIEKVQVLSDGSLKVTASRDVKEKIFRSGLTAVGWNHTKVNHRRRTTEEINALLEGVDPSRRRLYNPGVCDTQCNEGVYGEKVDSWKYDRIGGCTYDWYGLCNGGYYDPQNDDSEFCYYCFEYTKTVDAFNFNFNGDVNNPGAKVSPLKPANGADNFICKNCWAYLGASAFVVVDWTDSGSLGTAKVGVTGTAGFGFELILTGQGAGSQQSIQGTRTLSTVPKCIGTITIGGILSITPTCILESTVAGTLKDFTGNMKASASYASSTLMSGGYSHGSWSADTQTTYEWNPPLFSHAITAGTLEATFIIRPKLELAVSIGFSGIAEVTATGSVALAPTLDINLLQSESSRRLGAGLADHVPGGIFLTGTVEQGKVARVLVDSESSIEHLIFRLSSMCSAHNGYVVIDDVSVPQGRSNVGLPIPWHLALDSKCAEYIIEAYAPGIRGAALVSEPFEMTSCSRNSLVSKPVGGEVLDPTKSSTIKWDSSQLFFFDGHGMSHQGSVVPTKKVQVSLVGELAEATCLEKGLSAEHGCEETILIGNNVPNTGSLTFDFSKNIDAMGNPVPPWAGRYLKVRVQISASDHSLTTHVSQDSFSFAGSPGSGSKCFTDRHLNKRTASAIRSRPKTHSGTIIADRRLGTIGTLSAGYSMGLEANFKSVYLTLASVYTYTLWQDANTASPDLTYELISNSAAFDAVVAWTSSEVVSMSPTPKPNVPVPNPVTASPTPKPNVPVPNPMTASPTPKPNVPVPNPMTASPTPKPNVPVPNPMTASPTPKPNVPVPNPMTASPTNEPVPNPTTSSSSGRDDDYGYNYDYAYSPLDDDTVTSAAPNGTISCDTPTTIGTVKSGSVYYDLSVTESTMLTLSTCNSVTTFDTVIYIINDVRDTILVYNDDDFDCDDGSRKSTVVRDVVPGNYLVRVQEFGNDDTPSSRRRLNDDSMASYAYDDDYWANFTSDDDYWTSSTTLGGDFQLDVSCAFIPEASILNEGNIVGSIEANSYATYTFSVSDNTKVFISTCGVTSNFDTKLILYESDCLTVVLSNDDDKSCTAGSILSTIESDIKQGGDFCLQVHGWGSESGDYELTFEATPANPPTLSPTKNSGCLKTCNGFSCSEIDAQYGSAEGYCDYQGNDLVSQLGCLCASCDDCNTLGVEDISISMDMKASTIPEGTLVTKLEIAIATALGVSTNAFKDFTLSYVKTSTVARRLLTMEYLWTVSFEVSVSLGATSSANAADLTIAYADILSATNYTTVESSLTLISSTSTRITFDPSHVPTLMPSPSPSLIPAAASKDTASGINAGALAAGIVCGFLALVAVVGLVMYRKKLKIAVKECKGLSVESLGQHKNKTTDAASAGEVSVTFEDGLELKNIESVNLDMLNVHRDTSTGLNFKEAPTITPTEKGRGTNI